MFFKWEDIFAFYLYHWNNQFFPDRLVVGKIHPSHGCMFVACQGREHRVLSQYDVLVVSKKCKPHEESRNPGILTKKIYFSSLQWDGWRHRLMCRYQVMQCRVRWKPYNSINLNMILTDKFLFDRRFRWTWHPTVRWSCLPWRRSITGKNRFELQCHLRVICWWRTCETSIWCRRIKNFFQMFFNTKCFLCRFYAAPGTRGSATREDMRH